MEKNSKHSSDPPTVFPDSPITMAVAANIVFLQLFYSTLILLFLAFFAFVLRSPDSYFRFPNLPGVGKSEPIQKTDMALPKLVYGAWKFNFTSDSTPKICIVSTTSAGLQEILPWIFYHKTVGVAVFFLFVEGKAASIESHNVLNSIQGVKLMNRTQELETQQDNSRIWNETWLDEFKYKPCNYELFVKQTLNMETGIALAREAGINWIVHIDTDELLYPSGSCEYSVQKLLSELPESVDAVVFPNYESAVESDDVEEPFGEVTLFKKNQDHLEDDALYTYFDEVSQGNPTYFLTYTNGKSAARIQNNLRPNGAHRWYNYARNTNEITLEEAGILHYSYAKFSDLISRRSRCNCKLTREAIERCFILEFDRDAYIIASTGTEEEILQWYRDHVVLSDEEIKLKLLREGVLTRIYTPMVILQSLRATGIYKLFSELMTQCR